MDEELNKQELRSARAIFIKNLLKRPESEIQTIRYEDTTTAYSIMAPGNKRFKMFRTKSEDFEDAGTDITTPKVPLLIQFYDPEVKARDAVGRTLDDILAWDDDRLESCHNYIQMLFPLPEGSIFNFQAPVIDRQVMEAFHERSELRGRLHESFERVMSFYGFEIDNEERIMDDEGKDQPKDLEAEKAGELTTQQDSVISYGLASASKETSKGLAATEENPAINEPTTIGNSEIKATKQSESKPEDVEEESTTVPEAENTTASVHTQQHFQNPLPSALKLVRAPDYRRKFRNWAIRFDHNHLRMTRILRSLRVLGLQEECDAFYAALKEVFNDPAIYINERSMSFWRKAVRNPLWIAPDGERVMWLRKWVEEQKSANEDMGYAATEQHSDEES